MVLKKHRNRNLRIPKGLPQRSPQFLEKRTPDRVEEAVTSDPTAVPEDGGNIWKHHTRYSKDTQMALIFKTRIHAGTTYSAINYVSFSFVRGSRFIGLQVLIHRTHVRRTRRSRHTTNTNDLKTQLVVVLSPSLETIHSWFCCVKSLAKQLLFRKES